MNISRTIHNIAATTDLYVRNIARERIQSTLMNALDELGYVLDPTCDAESVTKVDDLTTRFTKDGKTVTYWTLVDGDKIRFHVTVDDLHAEYPESRHFTMLDETPNVTTMNEALEAFAEPILSVIEGK